MNVSDDVVLLRLFSPEGRRDPYPVYSELLERANVLPVGGKHAVVMGYQESADVLLNTRLFKVPDRDYADRSWPGWQEHPSTALLYRSLLFLNPPDNQPIRRLLSRYFNPGRVTLMRPMIERQADAHVAALLANGSGADAAHSFTALPNSVMGELLGIPHNDMEQLAGWLDMFLERNELHSPNKPLRRADDAAQRLAAYVREKLLGAQTADGASLIGSLAQLGALDERDLVSNLLFVLGAGTVTTSSLLGSGLLHLAQDNTLLRRLRDDDALLTSFVLETLRHDPPIQYGARVAAEDTELGGLRIARDSMVLVCLGAVGRDPGRFPNPNTFLADRFTAPASDPRDVLSFGLGTHRCAGAELALATAEIAFRQLAQRIDTLALASPPQRQNRMVVRKFSRLEVQLFDACPRRREDEGGTARRAGASRAGDTARPPSSLTTSP